MRYVATQKVARYEVGAKLKHRAWEEVWCRAGKEVVDKIMRSTELLGGEPIQITIAPKIYRSNDIDPIDQFVLHFDIEGDSTPTV